MIKPDKKTKDQIQDDRLNDHWSKIEALEGMFHKQNNKLGEFSIQLKELEKKINTTEWFEPMFMPHIIDLMKQIAELKERLNRHVQCMHGESGVMGHPVLYTNKETKELLKDSGGEKSQFVKDVENFQDSLDVRSKLPELCKTCNFWFNMECALSPDDPISFMEDFKCDDWKPKESEPNCEQCDRTIEYCVEHECPNRKGDICEERSILCPALKLHYKKNNLPILSSPEEVKAFLKGDKIKEAKPEKYGPLREKRRGK